jgi:hypothetical protein
MFFALFLLATSEVPYTMIKFSEVNIWHRDISEQGPVADPDFLNDGWRPD